MLSKKEGIPERDQWCYETDGKGQVTKLRENYLSLTGYRLALLGSRDGIFLDSCGSDYQPLLRVRRRSCCQSMRGT